MDVFWDLFLAVADGAGEAALPFKAEPVLTVGAPCCAADDWWAYQNQVALHFIERGKPTQNAFIESFNGKLRE
jgi:hypothetical protein